MRISTVLTTVAIFLLGIPLYSQSGESSKSAAQTAPKPQPIPFSHKVHSQFFPKCVYCHEMPAPGEEITYPTEAKCMACHSTIKAESPAIQKLAKYYKDHLPVPWVQVYSLPDFVFFSHMTHIERGKVACETCHGPVAERDVITREKDISMKACVDCHVERHARVACNTCHSPHP
jgi:hypothetical protein